MSHEIGINGVALWFDVEKRYKTIRNRKNRTIIQLWFDVEKRYKTIRQRREEPVHSCGLM